MKIKIRLTVTLISIFFCFMSGVNAQSFYLDMEPPGAFVNSGGAYVESGVQYPFIVQNAWGYGQLSAEGRNLMTPNSLKAVCPIDSRVGAVNRREWKFKKWQTNKEYWTGFSIKFPTNFPTPLNGIQSTLFAQLQNVWPGKQVAWYMRNSNSASDPLEFWCQIQYGESTANSDRIRVNLFPGTILPKGEWIDVVTHYKINPNRTDSFLKTWINGQLVVDYTGKIGIEGRSVDGDFKVGLYGGSQNVYREMNIDEIRFGNSYADVDPNQLVTGGPTIRVESESANSQSNFSPFQIGIDSNASNGQYISAPGNESKSGPPNNGNVSYAFNLASSGDADLTARVLASSTGSNSFWFKLDNNAWDFWSVNSIDSNWQVVSKNFTGLSSGNHTLRVAYREGGTKLDWFRIASPTSGQALKASFDRFSNLENLDEEIESTESNLNIYPNPARNMVNVGLSLTESSGYSATLFDFAGRMVLSERYSGKIGKSSILKSPPNFRKPVN